MDCRVVQWIHEPRAAGGPPACACAAPCVRRRLHRRRCGRRSPDAARLDPTLTPVSSQPVHHAPVPALPSPNPLGGDGAAGGRGLPARRLCGHRHAVDREPGAARSVTRACMSSPLPRRCRLHRRRRRRRRRCCCFCSRNKTNNTMSLLSRGAPVSPHPQPIVPPPPPGPPLLPPIGGRRSRTAPRTGGRCTAGRNADCGAFRGGWRRGAHCGRGGGGAAPQRQRVRAVLAARSARLGVAELPQGFKRAAGVQQVHGLGERRRRRHLSRDRCCQLAPSLPQLALADMYRTRALAGCGP
jgi:hypothetical protein